MIGDATLFQRADMVEAGWTVVDPCWTVEGAAPEKISELRFRHAGPAEADQMMENDGRQWRRIEA